MGGQLSVTTPVALQVPAFYTMCMRMEMYVAEPLWESLEFSEQCALFSVIAPCRPKRKLRDSYQISVFHTVHLPAPTLLRTIQSFSKPLQNTQVKSS